jgi:MFS family permease
MWAAGMIATGHLADRIGRKPPVVAGMLIQAAGLTIITAGISHALAAGLAGAVLLGTGTALVYPTLLAAVSDAPPAWRASALGVYRSGATPATPAHPCSRRPENTASHHPLSLRAP